MLSADHFVLKLNITCTSQWNQKLTNFAGRHIPLGVLRSGNSIDYNILYSVKNVDLLGYASGINGKSCVYAMVALLHW